MTPKNRLIRTLILALIGLAVGCVIAWMQIHAEQQGQGQSAPAPSAHKVVSGIALDGRFDLTDQNGKNVTQDAYGEHYKLIYFGFTYCPAICPTELQKISQVLKALSEDEAAQIQPLFITVDPERDTVEVMHEYVALFDPRLVGLTGTPKQIDRVKAGFKVFSSKVEAEDGSDYTVDHSSFIYLMSPDNQAVGIYRMQDDAKTITEDIRRILAHP